METLRQLLDKKGYEVWSIHPDDSVFDAIIKAGKLDKKGQGFAYIHKIDRAIGFLEEY